MAPLDVGSYTPGIEELLTYRTGFALHGLPGLAVHRVLRHLDSGIAQEDPDLHLDVLRIPQEGLGFLGVELQGDASHVHFQLRLHWVDLLMKKNQACQLSSVR